MRTSVAYACSPGGDGNATSSAAICRTLSHLSLSWSEKELNLRHGAGGRGVAHYVENPVHSV